MKSVLISCVALLAFILSAAAVSAAERVPTTNIWLPTNDEILQPLQVANKKGSKRVGGNNSKGKGSKYVGGRKRGK